MSEGLFREEDVAAISDGTGTELHLSPPALINRTSIATLVIFVISVTFIGNADYARSQVVYGKFDEHHVARVTAKQIGELVELSVSEGESVRKNQFLGRILLSSIVLQENLEHERKVLLNNLRQIQVKDREEYESAARHRLLIKRHANRELKLKLNDLNLQELKVGKLKEQLAQIAVLYQNGYLSNLEWLSFQTNLISEQQNLARQHQSLITLQTNLRKTALELETSDYRFKRRASENAMKLAEYNSRLVEQAERNSQGLFAPQDGTVTHIAYTPGETVFPGKTVLTVSSKDSGVSGSLYIPEQAIGYVYPGQQLELDVDAHAPHEPRLRATVANLSDHTITTARQAKGYLARLHIDNQSMNRTNRAGYLPGMTFKTHVSTERKKLFRWLIMPFQKAMEHL